MLEYRFEYGEGVTYIANSLGYREEYYYDENKLIYKLIDANGNLFEMQNRSDRKYDAGGEKTWSAELDIYGRVRTFAGSSLSECPFRYQGQYEDSETGLYYNRFRYYDPSIGSYISQDPIGLAGGTRLYGYVKDSITWIDPLGWHGNSLDNVADSELYEIIINNKTFKYGIANANPGRVTKTNIEVISPSGDIKVIPKGTPVRLKQQLRKAYSNYDNVEVTRKLHPQIATVDMKRIEADAIKAHVNTHGKVPSGNTDHARRGFGELADDFDGVHDLKKDLKMKKHH